MVIGFQLFEVGDSHFTAQDHNVAIHTSELNRRDDTYFTLDMKHWGLDRNSSGPDSLEGYLEHPGLWI